MTMIPQDIPQNAARPKRWSSTGSAIACPGRHHEPTAESRRVPKIQRDTGRTSRSTTVASQRHRRTCRRLAATHPAAAIKSP